VMGLAYSGHMMREPSRTLGKRGWKGRKLGRVFLADIYSNPYIPPVPPESPESKNIERRALEVSIKKRK
jgi:hypothetical protein